MTLVIAALENVMSITTTVLDTCTHNEILVAFLAAGFIRVGVGVFRSLRRAVR